MHPVLAAVAHEISVGREERFRNLAVVPLRTPPTGPDLVTLAEALEDGTVEITELDGDGSVETLRVVNRGAFHVLLFDGEQLTGAKQNRSVNTSIVVQPRTVLRIPVSCVERGRWAHVSRSFRSQGQALPVRLRRSQTQRVQHSLTTSSCYDAGQTATWNEISTYSRERGVSSRTEALADVMEAERPRLDDYVRGVRRFRGQTGLAVYIDGRFVGLDLVGRPEIYKRLHVRLLRSYATDALSRRDAVDLEARPSCRPGPKYVLSTVSMGDITQHTPPGAGEDLRISSNGLFAAALVHETGLVHLSAFPTHGGLH